MFLDISIYSGKPFKGGSDCPRKSERSRSLL